jgi:hypothetical protein
MKKLFGVLCLVFIVMGLGTNKVAAQKEAQLLIGTWKMDVTVLQKQFEAEMEKKIAAAQTEEEKQEIEMSQSMMPMLMSIMEDMRVSFDPDGTMRRLSKNPFASDEEPKEKLGTWRLEGAKLITQMEEDEESESTLLEINNNTFTMKSSNSKEDNPIKQVTFIRAE